ncbi:TPA: hypothetical protein ACMX4R_000298 [Yersinia enterocolitica]
MFSFEEASDSMNNDFAICDSYINALIRRGTLFASLDELDGDELFEQTLVLAWNDFYKYYLSNKVLLDKNTYFNRKYLSQRLSFNAEMFKENIVSSLSILLRVVYEFHFWLNDASELPDCISVSVFEALDKSCKGKNIREQFLWIERVMPASIARDFITSSEFSNIKRTINEIEQFEQKVDTLLESRVGSLTHELNSHKKEVEQLIDKVVDSKTGIESIEIKLEEYKKDYNFILLSKAFSKLGNNKRMELKSSNNKVLFFSFLLFVVPVLVLFFVFTTVDSTTEISWKSLVFSMPVVTLEIILFYFMRLYYSETRSIKAQLLQIEFRLSLCEFIHDYVEKRSESKDSEGAWKVFESLIFSPLQMNEHSIPSVLDGADAIAELAGKVMNAKK